MGQGRSSARKQIAVRRDGYAYDWVGDIAQRYYASMYGRFNTPDPMAASASANNPGSWNRYNYTVGDPVNHHDPRGLDGGDDSILCQDGLTDSSWAAGGTDCVSDGGPALEDPDENVTFVSEGGGGGVYDPCAQIYGALGFGATCTSPDGGGPARQAPQPDDCTLSLFRRPAKFRGNPGQHTYLDLCDDSVCQIVEGGRDNNTGDPQYGTLEGFINPPGGPGVLGAGTSHASNPSQNSQIGGTQQISCGDIGLIGGDVAAYNAGSRVTYAFLPNGSTTYNSNSFTYTLLESMGLQNDFGSFPTSIFNGLIGRPFFPGWGYWVPGL